MLLDAHTHLDHYQPDELEVALAEIARHLLDMLQTLADLRGLSVAGITTAVSANWRRLCAGDNWLAPWAEQNGGDVAGQSSNASGARTARGYPTRSQSGRAARRSPR